MFAPGVREIGDGQPPAVEDGDSVAEREQFIQLAADEQNRCAGAGAGEQLLVDEVCRGDVQASERILGAMDDIYALLVTIDYPDAITGNLRRSTDVARGILEKTRGDLSMSLVQQDLRDALDRHAQGIRSEPSE